MKFLFFYVFVKHENGGFLTFFIVIWKMYDTCVNVFCNITKKVLKSNGIFLILPFMRDPSTCERKHVLNLMKEEKEMLQQEKKKL